MTQPDTNANVVLTADVQPYQQSMAAANQSTNTLTASLDKLSNSVDNVFKKAGHRIELFSAGSLAGIGAAVTSLAALDAQMSKIRATASLTGGTNIKALTSDLREMSTQIPMSTAQLAQFSHRHRQPGRHGRGQDQVADSDLRPAAGGDRRERRGAGHGHHPADAVDVEVGPSTRRKINASTPLRWSNLSAKLGNLSDLDHQLRPGHPADGQALWGLTETQILGLAGAFSQAGADGTAAATALNQMMQIITNDLQTGNPQIKQFADLLHMSTQQFAALAQSNPQQAISELFTNINKQGPQAIQFLNSIGIDGVRSINAIQRVAQGAHAGQGTGHRPGSPVW